MKRLLPILLLVSSGLATAAQPVDVSHPVEPDGAVRVDISYGRIRITGSSRDDIHVTGEIDDHLRGVSIEDEAGAVEIRVKQGLMARLKSWTSGPSLYDVDLLIELPADARLFVVSRDADLEIEGVNGPMGVGVVSSQVVIRSNTPFLTVETLSGSLDFEGRAEILRASTLTGDIRARGVEKELRLEAVSGRLEAVDSHVHLARLETVSGSIRVEGVLAEKGTLEIQSESGEVSLGCCAIEGVSLDLETVQGEILNELNKLAPVREDNGHRVLKFASGQGHATVRVRTRSGHIWLLPIPSAPGKNP